MSKAPRVRKQEAAGSECTALVCTRSPRHTRFNDEEFYFLIGHIADPYYSNAKIAAKFFERFGRTLTAEAVRLIRHTERYQTLIAAVREQLANDISDIPIVNKRNRLLILQQAIDTASRPTDVDLRIDKDGGEHYLTKEQPELIPSLIAQVRREIEGDPRGGNRTLEAAGAKIELPDGFQGKISITQVIREAARDSKKGAEDSAYMRERLKEALNENGVG